MRHGTSHGARKWPRRRCRAAQRFSTGIRRSAGLTPVDRRVVRGTRYRFDDLPRRSGIIAAHHLRERRQGRRQLGLGRHTLHESEARVVKAHPVVARRQQLADIDT